MDCLEIRRIEFDLEFFLKFFYGNVDLKVDEFLQFDGKHKRNRLRWQLKNVKYPANNFGRLTISIAHIGLKAIFSNTFLMAHS